MFNKINQDITKAMKSGDKVRLEVLRMMKSKILNVNARGDLPEKDIVKILQSYAKTLKETIDITEKLGRSAEALQAKNELLIVEEYLPKMLSEDETKKLVEATIAELGVSSPKDMGKVMKEIAGKRTDVDGNLVRKIVSEI